tara:strand:- start:1234 stop:1644 length:411 start_codon:yes stop_codon:yes gene_type:complete
MTSQSVNLLFRDIRGQIFLQFRDANAIVEPFCWSFWGGRVEPYEKDDLRRAACREAGEELGLALAPEDFEFVHERQGSDGKRSTLLTCQRAISWNDVTIAEGAGGGFFPRESLSSLNLHKRLRYYCEEENWVFTKT